MMCPINLKKITTTTKIGRNIYFKNTRVDECTNEIMKLEAYCKQGPFFNRNRSHFWDGRMGQFYNKKKTSIYYMQCFKYRQMWKLLMYFGNDPFMYIFRKNCFQNNFALILAICFRWCFC